MTRYPYFFGIPKGETVDFDEITTRLMAVGCVALVWGMIVFGSWFLFAVWTGRIVLGHVQ
jgi:hypothetical protein